MMRVLFTRKANLAEIPVRITPEICRPQVGFPNAEKLEKGPAYPKLPALNHRHAATEDT